MTDKDAIHAKVAVIKRRLKRIRGKTKLDPAKLDGYDIQDIFILNLQRAIQAATDMAYIIIAENKYDMPSTTRAAFQILKDNDWIDEKARVRMQKMIGFRNIAVHDYQSLNLSILKSILQNNLSDFDDFYQQVLKKYGA